MVILFMLGLAIDMWFSQRLGQTSLLLLLLAGIGKNLVRFIPKPVSGKIILK